MVAKVQSCVKSGPDITDKVESDIGSLNHILRADIIAPRTHHRLRILLTMDLPELIKETRNLRRTIGQRYIEDVDYEYALQMENSAGREPFTLSKHFPERGDSEDYWGEKDERLEYLEWLAGAFTNSKFWMVKRRKAGKVERL